MRNRITTIDGFLLSRATDGEPVLSGDHITSPTEQSDG